MYLTKNIKCSTVQYYIGDSDNRELGGFHI